MKKYEVYVKVIMEFDEEELQDQSVSDLIDNCLSSCFDVYDVLVFDEQEESGDW